MPSPASAGIVRCGGLLFKDQLRGAVGVAVEPLVGVTVGLDGRSLQRDAGKQAACSRIAENLGPQIQVGRRFSIAPDRSDDRRGVATKLEFVLQQLFQAAAIHDHENQIHRLTTDLQAEAAAGQGQEGRL